MQVPVEGPAISKFSQKSFKLRVERMFPVYAEGPILGRAPVEMVNLERRNEYLANGCARSVDRGKAIHLLVTLEQFRGSSAKMGPNMTMVAAGVIEGNRRLAQAAAFGYMQFGTYCPLILAGA